MPHGIFKAGKDLFPDRELNPWQNIRTSKPRFGEQYCSCGTYNFQVPHTHTVDIGDLQEFHLLFLTDNDKLVPYYVFNLKS